MIRRSLVFILIGAATGLMAGAQTPVPRMGAEPRAFSLIFDGAAGYLGIETEEVTKENFGAFGLREVRGVAIEKVIDKSPAQAAGLQAGDVIVTFNGEDVTSVRKLTRLIADVAPDHRVNLTVLRNGGERELTATMAKRPAPRFDDGTFAAGRLRLPPGTVLPNLPDPALLPPRTSIPRIEGFPQAGGSGDNFFTYRGFGGRQIGIGVTPLTRQLADHYGVTGGLMINNVRENSPAAAAGLRAGDIVVEADGKEVKSDRDLVRTIAEKKIGDVRLTIVRDRSRQTLSVTPEEVKGDFQMFERAVPGSGERNLAAPAAPTPPVPLDHFFTPGRVL